MIGTQTATNNITFVAPFQPLPWQVDPWRDKAKTLLLTGSAGGGKSRLAAEKIHGFCKKYKNSMALMLRKTRNSMTNSTVLFMDTTIIGDDPAVTHYPSKNRFEYDNGSMLYWGGMKDDAQREGLRSIGQDGSLDIVWIEEANAFTRDDFNEILARMRGKAAPWRQVILSTNPDHPQHWIYTDLILNGEAKAYYSGALDNKYNPPSYIEFLNRLTGVLKARLVDGLWVQAEGAVYSEWDPSIHVIEPFEVPADWRRVMSIDFGYANPFVCQWWAIDNDGRMYLYREIYMSERLVEDHAGQITQVNGDDLVEMVVADWDAEDRATLERHGVYTEPATKDISPGIQAVKARLAVADDGRPRLFIMRGATVEEDGRMAEMKKPTSTEAEITGYVWPKSIDGKPIKEVPVKINDHGMDALRYAVMYVDGDEPWLIY